MAIDSMDEVFAYFNKLSGAKRIEVLSGIVHSCIPLEMRFLATLVESLAKKDYVTLLEDEHKANSPHELQQLCSTDLLADVSPFIRFPGLIHPVTHQTRPPGSMSPNNNATSSGQSDNGSDDSNMKIKITVNTGAGSNDQISPPPMSAIPDVVNITTYAPQHQQALPRTRYNPGAVHVVQPNINLAHPPLAVDCLLSNVRKKIVVYLCLLSSTNRVSATVLYEAFRKFLSADNLKRHLELCSMNMAALTISNDDQNHLHQHDPNQIVVQGPSGPANPQSIQMPILDPQLVAELTLIHTMAIYHPAFQYEQQAFLSQELRKLNELFNNLNGSMLYSQHHQQPFMTSEPYYTPPHLHLNLNQPSVATCMNQDPKKSIPLCCYNCGGKGHLGQCSEETLDEATRDTNFQINLKNPAPPIMVPSIMTPNLGIQIPTTIPHNHQQHLTPPSQSPKPQAPNISNRSTDLQNGPLSVTGRKNTLNSSNVGTSETISNHHQPGRGGDNYSSPPPSSNVVTSTGSSGSGPRRVAHQLYAPPHVRNRGNDRDQESSPRSSDSHREPARIVRIQNSSSRSEYGHHH